MRAKGILLIISAVGSFLVGVAAVARPQSLHQSFSPSSQFSCPDEEIIVGEGIRTSQICPEYEKKKACAGEKDVPLKIRITGRANLKLLGVSLAEQALTEPALGGQPTTISFSQSGRPTTRAAVPPVIEYTYKVNINREAKARKYQVRLKLQYPDETPFFEDFSLKVCSDGGIRISDDSPKLITCFTGREAAFRLKLSNAFEHYPVNIREIRIRTKPADLIEPREKKITYSTPESINHQENKPLDISFTLAGMSAEQLFRGFDADSKIMLDFIYDDGEDRELVDLKEIKLDVKPNWTVLVMAILVGVLFGCLIKLFMQYLEKTKRISRREQVKFILGTAVVGIVLSTITLFGKVQFVAVRLELSPDDPRWLFISSLTATVIGSELVYSWFKVPKSGESRQQEQGKA